MFAFHLVKYSRYLMVAHLHNFLVPPFPHVSRPYVGQVAGEGGQY